MERTSSGCWRAIFDFLVVLSYGGLTPHSEAGRADSPALGKAPLAASVPISSLQSHERLMPDVAREQIVQMLVAMDRLEAVENMYFAPIAIHYVGICPSAEADVLYHQYAVLVQGRIRSMVESSITLIFC
jgi:hypothetical protein